MKEKTITSVGDFLNQLNSYMQFFRGEQEDYGKTRLMASALRKTQLRNSSNRCKQFYSEVFSRLTKNETEHFYAFCQHHKIPTNLLDITTNPLTALFFSCNGSPEKDGFVYGFNEFSESGDVTNLVDNLDISRLETQVEHLCSDNRFVEFFKRKIVINILNESTNSDEEKKLKEIAQKLDNESTKWFGLTTDEADFLIDLLPVSLYQPLMSFERAVTQQSKFIFQWYSFSSIQYIVPHYIFKIPSNKKYTVLSELEKLNINRATVYQDFDSIAQYVVEKEREKTGAVEIS
jgi:hypothetical protein